VVVSCFELALASAVAGVGRTVEIPIGDIIAAIVRRIETIDDLWIFLIVLVLIIGPKLPTMLSVFLEHRRESKRIGGNLERQRRLTDIEIERKKSTMPKRLQGKQR
jgi:hypothetical protein